MNIKKGSLVKKGGVSLAISALLVGCGGGGGGNNNPPTTTPPPTNNTVSGVELSGTAAKGIISGGVVTAEELNSSGAAIATVGSAVTDDKGEYEIALNNTYTGGPIRISISKNASTKMKCDVAAGCGTRTDGIADSDDAIDFGEWYKPSSLTLTAMVPDAEDNETLSVNVTPYTHLAANHALSQGTLDSTAVANANSEVSDLLGGIDILNIQPIDITDAADVGDASPSEIAYASLSAAVATLADTDANGEPDLDDALQTLTDSFSGGTFAADDSGSSQDDDIFSLQEIIDAADETFTEAEIVDTSGVIASLESDINNASDSDGDGVADIDPEPSSSAGDTNLAKVKAMVSDMRTWGTVIGAQIETPGSAFEDQINLASESADLMEDASISEALLVALDVIVQYFEGEESSELDLNTYAFTSEYWPNVTSFASGTISSPEAGLIVIENGTITSDEQTLATIDISVRLPVDQSTSDSLEIGIVSADISTPYADAAIDSGTLTLGFASAYTLDIDGLDLGTAELPDTNSVAIDIDLSYTQKLDYAESEAAEQETFYADPVTFSGSFSTTWYLTFDGVDEFQWATPSTFVLSGETSNTSGDSITSNYSANITNADTFTPVDNIYLLDEETWLAADLENEENWLDANLGLSFSLELDGLPEATISITGDRTDFKEGTVTVTTAFGNRQIVITASGNSITEEVTGNVTITNQDGVVLIITPNEEQTAGVLSYNGNNYGTVSETESGYLKIEYIDNTFEIL